MPDVRPSPVGAIARRLAVILTFDRFPLAGCGCLGNAWIDTPHLDGLATDGFVFDSHLCTISPAMESPDAGIDAAWLQRVVQAGLPVTVIQEDEGCRPLALPNGCHTLTARPANPIETASETGSPLETERALQSSAEASEMPFARLIQTAREWLSVQPADAQGVLWLHSAGLREDAVPPAEAWDLYLDEFSEDEIDWTTLSDEELMVHPALRAATFSLMDLWLGELVSVLKMRTSPTLIHVSGLGGALWGPVPQRAKIPPGLEAYLIHTPWIVWESNSPRESGGWSAGRSAALVQPSDIGPSVLQWLQIASADETTIWSLIFGHPFPSRTVVRTDGPDGNVSLWTADDQWIFQPDSLKESPIDPTKVHRFRQPEDPWNQFDLASSSLEQLQDVVEWLDSTRR